MHRRLGAHLQRAHRQEDGVTGLETAIILIAFVIVASVFAFVVLSTGLFSAERGKQTVLAGLEKASGNVELRGSVTVNDLGTAGTIDDEDTIVFNLATAAAGRPIMLKSDGTTNTVVMNLVDSGARIAIPNTCAAAPCAAGWEVSWTLGDGDDLLENGELAQITVHIPAGITLDTNEEWTLEVIPPSGGTLLINRVMPPQIDVVMDMK